MKVSLNWVREYLDFELPPVDELVAKIGAQLGAVEEVTDIGARYKGIVIVKVAECAPIEGSDHLNLCLVDDGGRIPDVTREANGLVQVVCGAPNVAAGQLVAWLPPGTTVPSTFDSDPFVLSAKPLRGHVSNGMLASARELAIGDSHEGLLILDADTGIKPGDDFAAAYKLDDTIIDIENKMFTHRPDCFGILGIARELAGILGQPFTSPAVYTTPQTVAPATSGLLEIRNEVPELVPRFVAQVFQDVHIRPSPVWLQTYLSRVGIRPISNVVDITNYFMLLTGQPLHAYDYDKVKALDGGDKATLVVRMPRSGESLTLLNGKIIEPRAEAIMIATAKQAIGLGGVMGGAETEVDATTTSIILECASFDMYSIRRTSMAHGIFTDAVSRFNKGQSPLQNDRVMAWARDELVRTAGATPGDVVDLNSLPAEVIERDSLTPDVTVTTDFINSRLGTGLDAASMAKLLGNVECNVGMHTDDGSELMVKAPFWRTDIELREDVVEEVGRLHGFDKLPLVLPERDLTPAAKDPLLETKAHIREILADAGANEVLTYSFVHGNLLEKVGQNKADAFELSNALSPDLQYYRLSLTPSLLEKIHPNVKAGYDRFALFEIGKTHIKGLDYKGEISELERVALVFAGSGKAGADIAGAAYYQARKYLMNLLAELGLAGKVRFEPLDPERYVGQTKTKIPYYEVTRAASLHLGEINIGDVGEYKATVRNGLKLPKYCAGFELDLAVLSGEKTAAKQYVPLPKYPKVQQDISLKVPAGLSYQEVYDSIWTELGKVQPPNTFPTLGPVDIYQREDDPEHKQVTLRLSIASYEKTMTDAEVNQLLDAVATAAKQTLHAERI